MSSNRIERVAPGRILLGSLIATIALGTLLLCIPWVQRTSIAFIDILFTAVSATCVTSLSTIPIESFNYAGYAIILCLIQIGGLGLITMTLFLISMFMQLGYSTQILAGQLLELESWKNIRSLLIFICKCTLFCELVGTLLTALFFKSHPHLIKHLFLSLFHAVSAFCNAGFVVFPQKLVPLQTNVPLLITTIFLMLAGGIGFMVMLDIQQYLHALWHKKKAFLTLTTKIVLTVTSSLIICTTTLYWLLERSHAFAHLNPPLIWLNALFMAISSKSTGFTLVPTTALYPATLFMVAFVALIGSSPSSTGSGIKTTTFAILIATITTTIFGRHSVEIKGRRIPREQVFKALAIISLALAWIILATFLLLLTESNATFFEIFFEVISSFATLGLSMGLTSKLSLYGKIIIMLSMMVGRIGALTLIIALRKRKELHEFVLPKERVMLG